VKGEFVIEKRGIVPERLLQEMPEVSEKALYAGAVEWHEEIRPQHFEPGAKHRYSHTPRKRRYLARKRKYTGQAVDLVMTGETMRRTRLRRIRSNPRRAKVLLPAGFNRRAKGSRVRMRDEVTLIIRSDEREIVNAYESKARAMIAARSDQQTKRI